MQYRHSLFALSLALLSSKTIAAPAELTPAPLQLRSGPRVHMLADRFETFWQNAKSLNLDQQANLWRKDVEPTFRPFYAARFSDVTEAGLDPNKVLKNNLIVYPEIRGRYLRKSATIISQLDESVATFKRSFPAMRTNFNVYVMHSLGDIDGGVEHLGTGANAKSYFILGLDRMAAVHNFDNERPFIDHELFHIYQKQFFKFEQGDSVVIWAKMWQEGLATYASQQMNPTSSAQELLLDVPQNLETDCQKNIKKLWQYVSDAIDSPDTRYYDSLFLMSNQYRDVPPRAGYYMGYLIAKELGEKYTLDQMAHFTAEQAHNLMSEVIEAHLQPASHQKTHGAKTAMLAFANE